MPRPPNASYLQPPALSNAFSPGGSRSAQITMPISGNLRRFGLTERTLVLLHDAAPTMSGLCRSYYVQMSSGKPSRCDPKSSVLYGLFPIGCSIRFPWGGLKTNLARVWAAKSWAGCASPNVLCSPVLPCPYAAIWPNITPPMDCWQCFIASIRISWYLSLA